MSDPYAFKCVGVSIDLYSGVPGERMKANFMLADNYKDLQDFLRTPAKEREQTNMMHPSTDIVTIPVQRTDEYQIGQIYYFSASTENPAPVTQPAVDAGGAAT